LRPTARDHGGSLLLVSFLIHLKLHHELTKYIDVAGEYIRDNLVETEPGVELILDTQVIDVATCDPVPDVFIEIWGIFFSQTLIVSVLIY